MLIESTQFQLNDLQSVQSDLENLIQFGFDKPMKQNVIFLSIFFSQRQCSDYVNRQRKHMHNCPLCELCTDSFFFLILFHFKYGK